ncbi:hypothetical protein Tco_0684052 [Tanacetum coccineum]
MVQDNPLENEPTNALSIDDIDVNGYLISDVEQDNGSNRPYDVDVSQRWDEVRLSTLEEPQKKMKTLRLGNRGQFFRQCIQ